MKENFFISSLSTLRAKNVTEFLNASVSTHYEFEHQVLEWECDSEVISLKQG